jgi:hypothetical protein
VTCFGCWCGEFQWRGCWHPSAHDGKSATNYPPWEISGRFARGGGETNGSTFTTSSFVAEAGEILSYYFNYITSDGAGFADYAWAQLQTTTGDAVATLLTARTQPAGSIIPGFDMPDIDATLDPASVPIIPGAPVWSPLGQWSGSCFDDGCGYTDWVHSTFEIASAGTYVLVFGVTNWADQLYDSGLAFGGLMIGDTPIDPPVSPVPIPAALPLFLSGLVGMGFLGWRKKRRSSQKDLVAA